MEPGKIIAPHGGYRHLKSFQVAQLVYGTVDVVKLNSDGTFAWRNEETGVGEILAGLAYLNNVAVDDQGRSWFLFVTDAGKNAKDVVLSSYDPDGQRLSRTSLRTRRSADEFPGDVLVDPLGNPILTFYGQPNNARASGWITAKLPQTRKFTPVWPPPRRDW